MSTVENDSYHLDQLLAHNLSSKVRTADVTVAPEVTFHSIARIKGPILQGLTRCGFRHPSPIQAKTLPLSLIGMDLIVQSKSGTGKTVVFAVTALQALDPNKEAKNHPQVLILAPTREIAQQITDSIKLIGRCMSTSHVKTFIGGIDLQEDREALRQCNIAVGTPGRIAQLIDIKSFKTSSIRLLVLDEADKLIAPEFRLDINRIFNLLPERKQMLAVSATYEQDLADLLKGYMNSPQFLSISSDPSLIGVKQYYIKLPTTSDCYKVDEVLAIIMSHPFSQCIIFCNSGSKAESIERILLENDFSAVYMHGKQETKERLKKIDSLKNKRTRILISSDLVSRGIDCEFVDLVINVDIPFDVETYYHRIGRAGRFGSHGVSFTIILESGEEYRRYMTMKSVHSLPSCEFPSYHFRDLKCSGSQDQSNESESSQFNNIPASDNIDLSDENFSINFRHFLDFLQSPNCEARKNGEIFKNQIQFNDKDTSTDLIECQNCLSTSGFARDILFKRCKSCCSDENSIKWTYIKPKQDEKYNDNPSNDPNLTKAEDLRSNGLAIERASNKFSEDVKKLSKSLELLEIQESLTESDFVDNKSVKEQHVVKDLLSKTETSSENAQNLPLVGNSNYQVDEKVIIDEENVDVDYEDDNDDVCDHVNSHECDEDEYFDEDELYSEGDHVISDSNDNMEEECAYSEACDDVLAEGREFLINSFFPQPKHNFLAYQQWSNRSLPYFKYLSHLHQYFPE